MRRMMVALGAVVTSLSIGCPPSSECQDRSDCGVGQYCDSEGKCASRPPPDNGEGEGEGEGPGEGEGEGEPNIDTLVDTLAAVTMFLPDGAGHALVGLGAPGSGFDRIVDFDLDTGVLGDVRADFTNGNPSCNVDTVRFFDNAVDPFLELGPGDETWYSCANGVQVQYADQFAQRYVDPGIPSVELSLLLRSSDGTAGGADARVLVAARGGTSLIEVKLNSSRDAPNVARDVDAIPFAFNEIAALYKLAEGDTTLGDIVLVFDRGDTPRLVPLQRRVGSDTWNGPPIIGSQLDVLELPAETHFAFFRENVGIPDLAGLTTSDANNDTANLVLTFPVSSFEGASTGGSVRFLRYEREILAPGTNRFQDLLLSASDDSELRVPPAGDRVIFHEQRVGGETFFLYALSTSDHLWRFPLHVNRNDNRVNDVRRTQFDNVADRPENVLPFPPDPNFAWVALKNRNFIQLLEFRNIR